MIVSAHAMISGQGPVWAMKTNALCPVRGCISSQVPEGEMLSAVMTAAQLSGSSLAYKWHET